MRENNLHRANKHSGGLDTSNTFIEIKSVNDRNSSVISVEELLSNIKPNKTNKNDKNEKYKIEDDIDKLTLIVDPKTKKVKVDLSLINTPSVFSSPFNEDNINYNLLPADASEVTGMHMMANEDYLYIWVGNRWKRVPLAEW